MLAGYSAAQLKHMTELLAKSYPHLKLTKAGTKEELTDRTTSSSLFIASTVSKSASKAVSQEQELEKSTDSQPVVISTTKTPKRKSDGLSKKELEALVTAHNAKVTASFDPTSSLTTLKTTSAS